MSFYSKKERRLLENEIRSLPYKEPPAKLLDRLLGGIPPDVKSGSPQGALSSVSFLFSFRQWVRTHAILALFIGLGVAAIGAKVTYDLLTVREGAQKFNIDDRTLNVAIDAYRSDNGASPVYFRQLTTPVAYMTGSWDPSWGNERVLSEQEVEEWEALPHWAKTPYSGNFDDYRLWEPLSEVEREEWVEWLCDEWIRPHLVIERFSPEQKKRVLFMRDAAAAQTKAAFSRLVRKKASQQEFSDTRLSLWSNLVMHPMSIIFMEMRNERPLCTIRGAVEQFRKKHDTDPTSLGQLKRTIDPLAPGLVERLGDHPLTEAELAPPSKWEHPPWDTFQIYSYYIYNDTKGYSISDIYNGYILWWVDRFFQPYLLYYQFTPEQQERILEIRDRTYEKMKTTLKKLVARKSSRRTFEDKTTEVWDRGIEAFYILFEEMRKGQKKPASGEVEDK